MAAMTRKAPAVCSSWWIRLRISSRIAVSNRVMRWCSSATMNRARTRSPGQRQIPGVDRRSNSCGCKRPLHASAMFSTTRPTSCMAANVRSRTSRRSHRCNWVWTTSSTGVIVDGQDRIQRERRLLEDDAHLGGSDTRGRASGQGPEVAPMEIGPATPSRRRQRPRNARATVVLPDPDCPYTPTILR